MPAKTGRKDDLREQIVEWMLTVMRERDWSAERWAALAGTSPTNITRLVSGGESLPTTATLAKLAKAAGSQPSLVGRPLARADFHAVPLLTKAQVRRVAAMPFKDAAAAIAALREEGPSVSTLADVTPNTFAVRVETNSLMARGIVSGDIVIVEPHQERKPKVGSIVVALHEDKLGVWIYQPPMLVGDGVAVPINKVVIVGRAIQLERPLI